MACLCPFFSLGDDWQYQQRPVPRSGRGICVSLFQRPRKNKIEEVNLSPLEACGGILMCLEDVQEVTQQLQVSRSGYRFDHLELEVSCGFRGKVKCWDGRA